MKHIKWDTWMKDQKVFLQCKNVEPSFLLSLMVQMELQGFWKSISAWFCSNNGIIWSQSLLPEKQLQHVYSLIRGYFLQLCTRMHVLMNYRHLMRPAHIKHSSDGILIVGYCHRRQCITLAWQGFHGNELPLMATSSLLLNGHL